jgi:aspartyl aminopeptidase
MTEELNFAQDLLDFIHTSPSPYHVVSNIKNILTEKGFSELQPTKKWAISKGGKHFVTRNDSAIIAFVVGNGDISDEGFRILAAHTDSPTFSIKPSPEMVVEKVYLKLNTEVYGSPILNTWLDRPLSVAGQVVLKTQNAFHPETKLVNINRPILIIPNQSLHMNPEINTGFVHNKQKDTLPLAACVGDKFEQKGFLVKLLAKELEVDADQIIDFDLSLYEHEKGCIVGLNEEFISSTRLDNLAMVHAGLHALLDSEVQQATNVLVCYDNEEVGNRSKQGADSPWMRTALQRVVAVLGCDQDEFFRAVYNSFLVSADMGNGLHPNAPEKHDPTNRPVLNGGPIIKVHANRGFITDSESEAIFETLCRQAEVPTQRFVSRSDSKGGSTVGAAFLSQLDMQGLDLGNSLLGMHSIRELGGVLDHYYIYKAFQAYYSSH